MTNVELFNILRTIGAAYKIKDQNKNHFKIIAYEKAADAVEHLSSEAKDLWDDGELEEVAGIGESIAEHLGEIFTTGKSKHFENIMDGIPPATFELLKVNGIGPKTAFKLAKEFDISSKHPLEDLANLAKKGEIVKLPGFGKDSQEAILQSIKEVSGREIRLLMPYAAEIAAEIIKWMKKDKNADRVDTLGSLRRRASTVGDIDIAVATANPAQTLDHFTKYPKASRVLEKGDRTSSIIVQGNRQIDLMVEKPDAYGALLQHFTGSKHHNIALRKHALKHDMSLSDYGIYEMKGKRKVLKKIETEEEFYKKLGMDWIPPELREDRGEIGKALKNHIPKLVKTSDIKSDLHIHSDFDIETSHDLGTSSMTDLVEVASGLGYEYIAFSEHNPSKGKHNAKEIAELIRRKGETIDKLNKKIRHRFRVLPWVELRLASGE